MIFGYVCGASGPCVDVSSTTSIRANLWHAPLLPTVRLAQGAYPYIAKHVLSENQPEMVALLKATLITPEGTIAWRRLEQLVSAGDLNS